MERSRRFEYPALQANFKIYPNTGGQKGLELARTVERAKRETGAEFLVSPQIPDIRLVSERTELAVLAPYVDAVEPGRGMGRILPETLMEAGADGVMMNHPERRDTTVDLAFRIRRCRELGVESVVCADSIAMARAVSAFEPDAILCEKPGDIAGDKPITLHRPEYVEEFVHTVSDALPDARIWVGGGIDSPESVRRAFELGADAVGVASGIATAENPYERLVAIGEVMP